MHFAAAAHAEAGWRKMLSTMLNPDLKPRESRAEPAHEAARTALYTALQVLLLLAAIAFFALHAVHLTADFPNGSPWKDWSKYTDEGWYGDAAIRHFELGHWYVAGDFNPAAALPVWPLLEAALFHFTGVSLTAVRALTVAVLGGIAVASWSLLSRWRPAGQPRSQALAATCAVLLLVASPFVFVFTRLAILEPLLILLTLAALLVASSARIPRTEHSREADQDRKPPRAPKPPGALSAALRANLVPVLGLGLLLPAMVLTKTTGLFLVPGIAFLLFATLGYCPKLFLRVALPAAAIALGLWLAYYADMAAHHYLKDYRYLFSANGYTGITRATFFSVIADTLADGMWMGRLLYPAALVAAACVLAAGAIRPRLLRAHPLLPTLILWAAGYAFFLAYHDNLQPRYYLVIAVPLTLLLPATLEQLVLPAFSRTWVRRGLLAAAAVLLAAILLPDARRTLAYTRHPEYTLLHAARQLNAYIADDRRTDPTHNRLLLSISGSDISLMTGLPSICDDFGTLELTERVAQYRPGWYAAWNDVEDDKMEAMAPLYRLERVAAFPAMDDPDRNLLILYKLIPATEPAPPARTPKPTPRRLRTKVGQQPSVEQLEH